MFAFLIALTFCRRASLRSPRFNSKRGFSLHKYNFPKAPPNDSCEMCDRIVGYIEYLLNNTLIESEVAAVVSIACKTIPFPLSTGCSFLVKHYVPEIMQLIEQGIESIQICERIGFCTTSQVRKYTMRKAAQHRPRPAKVIVERSPIADQQTCLMCNKVIAYVEAAIEDEKIEEQVIEVVDQVCATFPSPFSTLCTSIIKASVPTIISWLEQGIEAIDICHRLGFCTE